MPRGTQCSMWNVAHRSVKRSVQAPTKKGQFLCCEVFDEPSTGVAAPIWVPKKYAIYMWPMGSDAVREAFNGQSPGMNRLEKSDGKTSTLGTRRTLLWGTVG